MSKHRHHPAVAPAHRHRAGPPPRPASAAAAARRHRGGGTRPRWGRIAAAATALLVTAVALLGGSGLLPGTSSRSEASGAPTASSTPAAASPQSEIVSRTSPSAPAASTAPTQAPAQAPTQAPVVTPVARTTPLPTHSGTGRRVVFSQTQQRVWLVGAHGTAWRTYLVSGSRLNNLDPGHYTVYSRSRWAVGIDDSGVMQYFVRFTQGPTGAAIGFHSIPTKLGTPLQTKAQLGTPRSHGCIRQALPNAIALWKFAPLGTAVDVVA